MQITKLISSLGLQQNYLRRIYTKWRVRTDQRTDHVCTCYPQRVDKRVVTKNQNRKIIEDKGHASIDDPIRRNPVNDLGGAGGGLRGGEGGRDRDGQRVYLIRRISEEGPISNIKDESDRSKDDPK